MPFRRLSILLSASNVVRREARKALLAIAPEVLATYAPYGETVIL
jgi:hypothetical protein